MTIIEVGMRDGLQNERVPVSLDVKLQFAKELAAAGLKEIEAGSFVSAKAVPQMADTSSLIPLLPDGPVWSALVPNVKGAQRAIEAGVKKIALFTAASDAFVQANIGMSFDESISAFGEVAALFRSQVPDGTIRAYVSTIVRCPFAGWIEPQAVSHAVEALLRLNVDEISLGETLGVAVPAQIRAVEASVRGLVPKQRLAWHLHDTWGTGIANAAALLELGCERFDASAGGLGGCPFAPGAGGNLATEDLVYFLHSNGVETGIDLSALARASLPVLAALGRSPLAKAQTAVLAPCQSDS